MAIQKHNESKTTAITQSRPQQIDSNARLLAIVKAGYPGQSMTTETAELYLTEFSLIAHEYGVPRLEEALRAAIRESKFFPSIAEIRDLLPNPPAPPNETLNEMRELEARQAKGEKFYGKADLLRAFEELEKKRREPVAKMPNVRTVFTETDPGKENEWEALKRKAKEVADKMQERARASAGDRDE